MLLLLLGTVPAGVAAEPPSLPYAAAALQALDKVTARVTRIVAPVDRPVRFGSLAITVRACLKTPPTEAPESAAFLTIDDIRPGSQEVRHVFSGWMFASSPAVSALEHPVYDVWVVDCEGPLPPPAALPSSGGAPAAAPPPGGTPGPTQSRQNN